MAAHDMPPKSQDADLTRLQARRQVLRMGAVGLPMMMTMRASAQTVVSQLQCTIQLPNGFAALIAEDGAVWMANVGWVDAPDLTQAIVDDFIDQAESGGFVFAAGTAPQDFRPDGTGCSSGGGYGSGDEDDEGDDDADNVHIPWWVPWWRRKAWLANWRAKNSYKNSYGGGDDDDEGSGGDEDDEGSGGDEDDEGNNTDPNCAYNVVIFDGSDSFQAVDVVDLSGNFYASGNRQLYLELAQAYLQNNPNGMDFPAISCIVSVMAYTSS